MPADEATRERTFEALFRDNHPAVLAYALRRADPEVANDVVAETFLVAWRRLERIPQDPLPWLYGVARRVLANQRRSAKRGSALAERLATAEQPHPASDPADTLAERESLRAALSRLREQDRELLMLVAWEGLAPARASKAAGCSRATFAVRLHRARARLARELESEAARPAAAPDPLEAR